MRDGFTNTQRYTFGIYAVFLTALLLSGCDPKPPEITAKPPELDKKEEYKVLDARPYPSSQEIEQQLNKLAADGWKVRTTIGGAIIFARPAPH